VVYVHGEYLIGRIEGMNTPPLVIQDDNPDFTSADIIYGGDRILEDERDGFRITLGVWLDDYGKWGVEGDYLNLGDLDERFTAGTADGLGALNDIFIGRPANNTLESGAIPRGPVSEDVDANGLDGTVTVDSRSEFRSAGIRLVHNLCCVDRLPTCCGDSVACGSGVDCGSGVGCPIRPLGRICDLLGKGVRRTDVLYGFRWAELNESLRITEDLETLPLPGTTFDIFDLFDTSNEFFGGEIGFQTQWEHRRWSLGLLSKIAIGNTQQRVRIDGETITTEPGGLPTVDEGGFLALPTNIGSFSRDEFSVLPELGLTLGYRITPRLRFTAGYSLIYWSNVLRPGDQIDLDINVTQVPSEDIVPDLVANDHPRFEFRQTDVWAQFLSLGAEYTW